MAQMTRVTLHYDIDVPCPACKQPLGGRATVELSPQEMVGTEIKMTGKIVGLAIQHDCTPRVTR